jgi:hypothetical protein
MLRAGDGASGGWRTNVVSLFTVFGYHLTLMIWTLVVATPRESGLN